MGNKRRKSKTPQKKKPTPKKGQDKKPAASKPPTHVSPKVPTVSPVEEVSEPTTSPPSQARSPHSPTTPESVRVQHRKKHASPKSHQLAKRERRESEGSSPLDPSESSEHAGTSSSSPPSKSPAKKKASPSKKVQETSLSTPSGAQSKSEQGPSSKKSPATSSQKSAATTSQKSAKASQKAALKLKPPSYPLDIGLPSHRTVRGSLISKSGTRSIDLPTSLLAAAAAAASSTLNLPKSPKPGTSSGRRSSGGSGKKGLSAAALEAALREKSPELRPYEDPEPRVPPIILPDTKLDLIEQESPPRSRRARKASKPSPNQPSTSAPRTSTTPSKSKPTSGTSASSENQPPSGDQPRPEGQEEEEDDEEDEEEETGPLTLSPRRDDRAEIAELRSQFRAQASVLEILDAKTLDVGRLTSMRDTDLLEMLINDREIRLSSVAHWICDILDRHADELTGSVDLDEIRRNHRQNDDDDHGPGQAT